MMTWNSGLEAGLLARNFLIIISHIPYIKVIKQEYTYLWYSMSLEAITQRREGQLVNWPRFSRRSVPFIVVRLFFEDVVFLLVAQILPVLYCSPKGRV